MKDNSNLEIDDNGLFAIQLARDIEYLFNIKREMEYDPVCAAADHKYKFCTQCTDDIPLALDRITRFEQEKKKQ